MTFISYIVHLIHPSIIQVNKQVKILKLCFSKKKLYYLVLDGLELMSYFSGKKIVILPHVVPKQPKTLTNVSKGFLFLHILVFSGDAVS